ncbi:hypothetical protein [Microcoleus phage My-WqHQDG]|nr:hypothetical protein [Microcoleus phage My-WqHQDG]
MPTPCRPDSGSIQEFIDALPGRDECCWYMTGVQVKVTRITTETINLCIPTPEEGDPLKYIEAVMALALPLLTAVRVAPVVPNSPVGEVVEVQSVTPTWHITQSFE